VQCSLGGDTATFAGPGMTKTGTSSARKVGVTDTAAAEAFQVNDFASIQVSGSKTVLLSRTGNYVGTYAKGGSASGTNTYNFGTLPTIAGNNYGPKACPSSTTLASASTASKEELRMCGSIGKWVYFGAANLLLDKNMYAKYSGDSATGLAAASIAKNIKSIPFLSGDSAYRSGTAMDDSRAVYLHDGAATSASILMTSQTITPAKSTAGSMGTQDVAGTWRFYSAVFYCDNYARTDLTACPADNQKIFYVADPNPAAAFGVTAAAISGGSAGTAAVTGTGTGSSAGTATIIASTKRFVGSFTMKVSDAAAFKTNTKVKEALQEAIANTITGVDKAHVTITSVADGRRLTEAERSLAAAGSVKVGYEINLPKTSTLTAATMKAALPVATLMTNINTAVAAKGVADAAVTEAPVVAEVKMTVVFTPDKVTKTTTSDVLASAKLQGAAILTVAMSAFATL